MAKTATVFDGDQELAKVGIYQSILCVDKKVHIFHEDTWENDDNGECHRYFYWGKLEPCDGSCHREMELPAEVEELVRRFLESGGQEKGEIKIPKYPE